MYSVVSPRLDLYNGKIKNPAYTASKHGLIGLTKHLAVILAKDNIQVNCIAPGGVKETIHDKDFIEKYNNQVPMNTTITIGEIIKTINYEKNDSLKKEIDSFVDCIRLKKSPIVSSNDGINALKYALEISKKIKR